MRESNRRLLAVALTCLISGLNHIALAKPPIDLDQVADVLKPLPQPQSTVDEKKATSYRQNEDGTEFWQYVDVRPQAHMFYWLYRSTHAAGYTNRPLIIWFQGGPGGSSCGYGNFDIIGPLRIDQTTRDTTWVKEANVLFIDNPVGAGYSYVDSLDALTTDVQQVTDDLMVVIRTFMDNFPEFRSIPIYVFGQSYGGKMAAHFALHLYNEVKAGKIDVTITAFAMGNAWISPVDSTMTWGPLLYQMSLVDEPGLEAIQTAATSCKKAVDEGRWTQATTLWRRTQRVVLTETHNVDFYDILKFNNGAAAASTGFLHDEMEDDVYLPSSPRVQAAAADSLDVLMNGLIRAKLGIIPDNVVWGAQSDAVFRYQEGDFMKPVIAEVDAALANTTLQVIVYQGQLDLICDTAGALDWVQKLKWKNLGDYNSARRKWFVNSQRQNDLYVKAYDKFKFYWVLAAGHAAPKDNGETSYRMLQRILDDKDK